MGRGASKPPVAQRAGGIFDIVSVYKRLGPTSAVIPKSVKREGGAFAGGGVFRPTGKTLRFTLDEKFLLGRFAGPDGPHR